VKIRYRLFAVALMFQLATLSAGLIDFRAPTDLSLPAPVSFVEAMDSPWQTDGSDRLLAEGRYGLLETPAWWKGNRPARQEMVVLVLEYQDRLVHPAIAEVYSGLGTTNPFSELHRFGGQNDGQWKQARIPASADFIFRWAENDTLRFRVKSVGGELRVRRGGLEAPLPDEEARYNADTRQWVEREQKRAEVSPRYYRMAQNPYLTAEVINQPLVPFRRNWMDLVLPISAPQPSELVDVLKVQMFRNEYEPLQVGVYANGRDLDRVTVSLDPLKDSEGKAGPTAEVRVAEYAKVRGGLVASYLIQPFPQRLWPAFPFHVSKGQSHLVWIVLGSDEKQTRPGTYRSELRFRADGVPERRLPIEVTVREQRLLTMEEAKLKLGGCTTGLVPEFELDFLHRNNHNMVNIWYAGVRPGMAKDGDSLSLEFRIMDEWMAAARRQGISDLVYFLGGNPYGFPETMNLPRTLAATMLGLDGRGWRDLQMRNPYQVPAQVAPLIVDWTRRFAAHAREAGWPNVVLTPFDEPAKYIQYRSDLGMLTFIKPQFKEQIRLLRQGAPQAQIYGSIHHYDPGMDFLEDVDIFCTNAVPENTAMPDQVRAGGKILWEYSGTTDQGLPGVARYTFGYYFAAHDSRGSLVWAYNWGNRFDTLDGSNWMYTWNTPFDVVPTPYFEGMREAWDDRRLLETLKWEASRHNVDLTNFLGRLYTDIVSSRGRGGSDTVDDFWEQARSNAVMDEWRDRMIRKLAEITGSSN